MSKVAWPHWSHHCAIVSALNKCSSGSPYIWGCWPSMAETTVVNDRGGARITRRRGSFIAKLLGQDFHFGEKPLPIRTPRKRSFEGMRRGSIRPKRGTLEKEAIVPKPCSRRTKAGIGGLLRMLHRRDG